MRMYNVHVHCTCKYSMRMYNVHVYAHIANVQSCIAVVAACRTNYRPHREQAIDEAMIPFKGRLSMKKYPIKAVKCGFKVWVRADSRNGYVSEFECYTGRKGDTTEVGLGGSVVTRLTSGLVGITSSWIVFHQFFCIVIGCLKVALPQALPLAHT